MNNKLLYGHDDEKYLVGASMIGGDKIRLYKRTPGSSEVDSRDVDFHPWAVLSDDGLAWADANLRRLPRRRLAGNAHFRHLVAFEDWWEFLSVRKKLRAEELDFPLYAPPNAVGQYLTMTGKTLFKGMVESDLLRMQIDIETYSERHGFPQADRAGDAIIIVSISTNRGYEKAIHLTNAKLRKKYKNTEVCETEAELLRALVREIGKHDPDALELHNGLGYDLPYIETRCDMLNVEFRISRTGEVPRKYSATKKFAERDVAYENYQVEGRAIIDTMFLAMAYDVFTRELPGVGLKACAQHFGFAREGRVYVPGGEISATWERNPARLVEYALDDVRETRQLSETLGGAVFYLTQMVPMTYQAVHLGGTAGQIESMLVRGYLRAGHSLPKPQQGKQEVGGYTRAFLSGRFEHIVYADVDSLYPYIMLTAKDCLPASDTLGLARDLLTDLRAERFVAKDAAKSAAAAGERSVATTMRSKEQSFKVVINSMYGAQGFGYFIFNDFAAADRVASNGQSILKEMVSHAEDLGGFVIEIDTDGIMFVAPEEIETDEAAKRNMVAEINRRMSWPGVSISVDGLYKTMLSYRAKNYALVGYNGEVKMKGGAFKNRGIASFYRDYMARQINNLLAGNIEALWHEHERAKTAIYTRAVSVEEIASKATLKDTIDTYLGKVEAGNNRSARYELAIKLSERTGRAAERGDVLHYYIAGEKSASTVTGFEDAVLLEDFADDYNVKYYLRTLHTIAERFECFFAPEDFGMLFVKPPRNVPSRPYVIPLYDELEPPDLTGVSIQNLFIDNQ